MQEKRQNEGTEGSDQADRVCRCCRETCGDGVIQIASVVHVVAAASAAVFVSREAELQQDAVHAILADYACIYNLQPLVTCFSCVLFFLCVEGEGRSMRLLVVLTAHTAAP